MHGTLVRACLRNLCLVSKTGYLLHVAAQAAAGAHCCAGRCGRALRRRPACLPPGWRCRCPGAPASTAGPCCHAVLPGSPWTRVRRCSAGPSWMHLCWRLQPQHKPFAGLGGTQACGDEAAACSSRAAPSVPPSFRRRGTSYALPPAPRLTSESSHEVTPAAQARGPLNSTG